MRAVLTLSTPGHDLTLEELTDALAPTTWLPRGQSADWLEARTSALVGKFPADLQAQLEGAPRLLIQVGLSVEGLVSLERHEAVMVRLVHEVADVAEIKEAVTMIAGSLPGTFRNALGSTSFALHPEIDIRQIQDGATISKGKITSPSHLHWWSYLKFERVREWRLLISLVGGFAATLALALGLAVGQPLASWLAEVKNYTELISAGFFVATVTTLVNLVFEYRDWRSEQTEVRWLFG